MVFKKKKMTERQMKELGLEAPDFEEGEDEPEEEPEEKAKPSSARADLKVAYQEGIDDLERRKAALEEPPTEEIESVNDEKVEKLAERISAVEGYITKQHKYISDLNENFKILI